MYPPLPTEAPLPENPLIPYHLNVVQAKRRGLINKEKMFKKKYKKYTKDIESTYMVKCLFEWNKHSHWNI